MKICMLVEDYPPNSGGGGIFVYELSKRLALTGNEITIVTKKTSEDRNRYGEKNMRILELNKNKILFFLAALTKLSGERAFDVYHGHGTFCGLLAKVLSLMKNRPAILQIHGYRDRTVGAFKYYLQNFILKLGYAKIISVDKYGMSKLLLLGIKKESVVQINGGVDLDGFTYLNREKKEKPVFLFVGRLDSVKNLELLVQTIKKLGDRMELKIAGAGPLKEWLIAEIAHNPSKNINYLGTVEREKLLDVYGSADFLVLPSKTEGQPLVVLEALATGLPIILSDIPTLRNLAEESQAGLLFSLRGPDGLEHALEKAAAMNGKEYADLAKKARNYVEKNFSWDSTSKKIAEVYQSVCKNSK